jgi:hypothetical protein
MKWLLLLAALPLGAQELSIVPASFSVSAGERLTIAFRGAERVDAVRDATLLAGTGAYNVTNLRVDGSDVSGDASVKAEGTLIVYAGARSRASAKALLLSRASGPLFGKQAGMVFELVPEADPYTLKPGDALTLQTLLHGKPVACTVHVKRIDGDQSPSKLSSDGRVKVPLAGAGRWLITAVTGDGYSTTLTFEVF